MESGQSWLAVLRPESSLNELPFKRAPQRCLARARNGTKADSEVLDSA